ncbi:unnamed protein product, partial [Meganyctiphanes norvegica]
RTCKYRMVGQNVFYDFTNNSSPAWERAFQRWYDEVDNMVVMRVYGFDDPHKILGHYTQMVWANTTAIGCGAVHYNTTYEGVEYTNAKIYVCNYGPGGNIYTSRMYNITCTTPTLPLLCTTGLTPASDCDEETDDNLCNLNVGLCGGPEPLVNRH